MGPLLATMAALVLAAPASAHRPTTTQDHDAYSFTYGCDSFDVSVEGLDTGSHTIFCDRGGAPVRNEAHHTVRETHTNRSTGRSVEFRGHYTSTYVYATDT